MKSLICVRLPQSSLADVNVQKFAEWMGIQTKAVVIDTNADIIKQLPNKSFGDFCLAMSAETLAILQKIPLLSSHLHLYLQEQCSGLFVFGWEKSLHDDVTLSWITNGAVERVIEPEPKQGATTVFHLPSSSREFSRQMAGLGFSLNFETSPFAFQLNPGNTAAEPILLADERPVFVYVKTNACRLFLVAGPGIPDIDEPLSRHNLIEDKYDQVIPLLTFLLSCFGAEAWHGSHSTARFVIDDPLLEDCYGLLDYRELLDSMQRENYGTSIAFIPWNHLRTSKRWVEDLLQKKVNLSICVHGCDHSNREFAGLDRSILMQKAYLALDRMEEHQQRTRMPFERVMVFPQGRFSKSAILALKASDYLAAVNTSCFPDDCAPDDLRLGDFLRPAITRFHGFPIFQRHYPKRGIDSAFDLFLGKPALLVEHHQYLGDGCRKLEEFVRQLHRIEPKLLWPSLSSQLSESCIIRRRDRDSEAVHFFTKNFKLKNSYDQRRRSLLEKEEPDMSLVCAVLEDGKSVPFQSKANLIQFEIEANANQTKEIEVQYHSQPRPKFIRPGMKYKASVFLRRELSEFRDKTLSKHPGMLRAGKRVAKSLKMTGESKSGQ